MTEEILVSYSSKETVQKGRELAGRIHPPLIVYLSGDLGAGKTTLAKGIIAGLGAAREEEVVSPTFTLVHLFHGPLKVYHIDLYRVECLSDLGSLGLEDLFEEAAVILIEWPERFLVKSDWPVMRIHLGHLAENKREIRIMGDAENWLKRRENS